MQTPRAVIVQPAGPRLGCGRECRALGPSAPDPGGETRRPRASRRAETAPSDARLLWHFVGLSMALQAINQAAVTETASAGSVASRPAPRVAMNPYGNTG